MKYKRKSEHTGKNRDTVICQCDEAENFPDVDISPYRHAEHSSCHCEERAKHATRQSKNSTF